MTVKSAQAITVLFSTANATTGAAEDATVGPAGTLYVDGTANAAVVTVTNITTGVYKAAVTLPALTAGQIVSLRIAATVGVAAEGVVWQDVADTSLNSDIKTDTAAILLDTGTDGVIVNTHTATAKAEIESEATDALNAYDPPTNAELEARTLASADYLVEGDTLARVTLVDTTTSNSDMRGTDNAALATAVAALNNLSSAQAQAAATAALNAYDPPTKAELDAADDAVLDAIAALNNIDAVAAQAAAAAALAAYNAAKVGDAMGAVASVTGNVGGNVVGSVGSVTNPVTAGVASTFREIVVQSWRRMFKKATMTAAQMVTYADDGATPLTTQAVSDDGATQTQGAAS